MASPSRHLLRCRHSRTIVSLRLGVGLRPMVLFVVCLVLNGLSPFLTTSRAEGVVVSTGEETNPSNTTSSANSTGTINNSSIIVTPTNGTDYYMDDLYNPTHPSSPHADDDTGFSTPGGSSSGSSNITGNPNYPSGGGNIQSPPSGSSGSNGGDAYEFVAFLLWYVFLVLCCIIPTCFAYRRRRMVEEERLHRQQQDTLQRFQQQSLYFLSNLQASAAAEHSNEQNLIQIRTELLQTELERSTMVVTEADLVAVAPALTEKIPDLPSPIQSTDTSGELSIVDVEGESSSRLLRISRNRSMGDRNPPLSSASMSATFSGADPRTGDPAEMTVSGACTICLCPYEAGDRVSWSPLTSASTGTGQCTHAFHTDCITTWLSKKDEPKCPVCRQDFCRLTMPAGAARDRAPSSFYPFRWPSAGGGIDVSGTGGIAAAGSSSNVGVGTNYLPSFFSVDASGRLVLMASPSSARMSNNLAPSGSIAAAPVTPPAASSPDLAATTVPATTSVGSASPGGGDRESIPSDAAHSAISTADSSRSVVQPDSDVELGLRNSRPSGEGAGNDSPSASR